MKEKCTQQEMNVPSKDHWQVYRGEDDPTAISWNRREKKTPWLRYMLLVLFCMMLAFVLSGASH